VRRADGAGTADEPAAPTATPDLTPAGVVLDANAATRMAPVPLAVLPFANMGGDPEQDYFSDGISEDIITELSRWRMLAVRSRAASFRFRGVAVDVREVARELDVRFIVEGSVRRMGDRVRITAQLIDAEAGTHVWAEKYDRAQSELFAVQDEVVRTIVGTLVGRVQARDAARARRKPPSSLAAYECVLKGNALPWAEPDGFAEATRLFEQAIALDPEYGLAHALLAAMRYGQWYDDPVGVDDALVEAFALATRGVELDPDESTCHSLLAQVHHLRGEFDLCLQHVQRAVELNPSNQWNVADMGMMLNYLGEAEQALAWFDRALRVDPYFDPPWYWREYGQAFLLLHRHEEAVAMFSRLNDRHYRHLALKAAAHALLGNAEAARHAAAECLAVRPGFSIAHFFAKTPFRRQADADYLAAAMRLAGLPERAVNQSG
jgi:TolB-like protein